MPWPWADVPTVPRHCCRPEAVLAEAEDVYRLRGQRCRSAEDARGDLADTRTDET